MVRVGPKVFVELRKKHCNSLEVIDLIIIIIIIIIYFPFDNKHWQLYSLQCLQKTAIAVPLFLVAIDYCLWIVEGWMIMRPLGLSIVMVDHHNHFNFIWYWYHKKSRSNAEAVRFRTLSCGFSSVKRFGAKISLPCFSSGRHSNLNLHFLIWLIVFDFKVLIPRPRDDDLLSLSVLSVWFVNMVCLHNLNCYWLVETP